VRCNGPRWTAQTAADIEDMCSWTKLHPGCQFKGSLASSNMKFIDRLEVWRSEMFRILACRAELVGNSVGKPA
jgi:hypothetical protein